MILPTSDLPVADFPPSAAGNPVAFGAALFSLTTIVAVAIAVLLWLLISAHHRERLRHESRLLVFTGKAPGGVHAALKGVLAAFSVFLLFGAMPDMLILLCWGEVTQDTLALLMVIDRQLDALILFPFLLGCGLLAWILPSLTQAVAENDFRSSLPPMSWRRVLRLTRIPSVVFFISFGVTIGKAAS